MNQEKKDELNVVRRLIPELKPSDLLGYYKKTVELQISRYLGVISGLRPVDEDADQQYRLTLYTLEQEILRRMNPAAPEEEK